MNEIRDVNLTFPARLFNAGRRIAQLMDKRLDAVGLSGAKFTALQSIVGADEAATLVTVTCLADAMNTTKSNVTAMVDRLIAEGLVTRQQSQEDRRTVVIALTAEGQRRYAAGVEVVQAFHEEIASRFSTDEQRLLNLLIDNLME